MQLRQPDRGQAVGAFIGPCSHSVGRPVQKRTDNVRCLQTLSQENVSDFKDLQTSSRMTDSGCPLWVVSGPSEQY